MTTPTDPLYASQWHFGLLGNIERIWDEYSGAGVHVGVYDDGIDLAHEDLASNYDATRHVVDGALNPIIPVHDINGAHGTATAGLIGAAMNSVGGVGVAWGVGLTAVNIFNPALYGYVNAGSSAGFMDVVHQAATRFDITSHSWGATPLYLNNLNTAGFAQSLNAEYSYISANGRAGLGTIVVQAAGNDNLDANGDGVNASRFTITVAATEQTGIAASYSNYGAAILVAAPAASVTTDRTGADGYDAGNYTSTFNGTSAATPVVSGVVALMTQANAGLGWRDVQDILAMSATLTGSAYNAGAPTVTEEGLWQSNHSGIWNGGGNHIHTNYGYGMVNAYNAVRMAEVWSLFDTAQTSANESSATIFNDFADVTLIDNNATGFNTTFVLGTNLAIDHVKLDLNLTTTYIGDLNITLTSAQGTVITLAKGATNPGTNLTTTTWSWMADQLHGELSAGTWTLHVADISGFDITTLFSSALTVYGATPSVNNTYHITDEYLTMLGFDAGRASITDANGGTDWLDLAAVQGDVSMDMTNGVTFTVDGVNWAALSGDFENVVTGDGNDTIIGNGLDNVIYGMRGDDVISGGDNSTDGGAGDTLYGGAGNDTIGGDSNKDDAYGGAGDDRFVQADGFYADNVYGGDGTDTLDLSGFNFINFVVDLSVSNYQLAPNLSGANGTYDLFSVENVLGSTGNDTITGDAKDNQLSGNGGDDVIYGGSNVIFGGAGDTLYGGAGNDTLDGGINKDDAYGGTGNDLFTESGNVFGANVYGGADIDTLDLSDPSASDAFIVNLTTQNYQYVANPYGANGTYDLFNVENVAGSILSDSITGDAGANVLSGGLGNDTITGGGGVDTLAGGAGNDWLYVDSATDIIDEIAGGGSDRVLASVSFTLAADDNIESLGTTSSIGVGLINLTGNGLAQAIYGNNGANNLQGLGGADTLYGNAGADSLNGGTGIDRLVGGADGDSYYVDNAADIIDEVAGGGGTDRVFASVNFTLALDDNIESLGTTFSAGTGAINLTGNDLSQAIYGNAGINNLQGLAGADTLYGFAGTDTINGGTGADSMVGGLDSDWYFVDIGTDIIDEVAGGGTQDRVLAAVTFTLAANDDIEILATTLSSGLAAINLTGNALSQAIYGNNGANNLNGGAGNDYLTGNLGADRFIFTTAPGGTNYDRITDYTVADDTIVLENAIFTGLAGPGLLAGQYEQNLTGVSTLGASRVIYETDTGKLFFDVDGAGGVAGVLFAQVTANLQLLGFGSGEFAII